MTSPAHDLPPIDATVERLLAEGDWLRALARSLVVDASTADDVAQDATILALTKPPREPAALRSWLRRVVGRLASNARRAGARREARESGAARPQATREEPSDVVLRWELRKQVVDAVLALDEPYRTTVLLRFFEGLEPDEIAARLGVPRDTVKTRQRRALEMLRARLAHLDDRAGRRGLAVLLVLARPDGGGVAGSGAAATAGAASGAGGLALGGLAMSAMTKTLAGAALLAVIAAGWWTLRLDARRDVGDAATAPATTAPADSRAGRAKRPAPPVEEVPAFAATSLAAVDRERDLHGVVLTPDGAPVAGAKIEVLRMRPMSRVFADGGSSVPWDVSETTTSAADGTFALRLAAGDDVALRVDAADWAIWESIWRQPGERVTVRLARAVTLEVAVLDAARAPVAGATVRARSGQEGGVPIGRRETTAAQGQARLARLPSGGEVIVHVEPSASPDASRSVTLTAEVVQTVEFVLATGVTVRGVVVDSVTGATLEGARVARGEEFVGAVTTGPDGRFALDGLQAGHAMRVYAEAAGHARGTASAEPGDEVAGRELRIALGPAASVTGRVLGPDGAPVAGADVVVLASWRGEEGKGRSYGGTQSATDGRFEVTGLAAGRAHTLRVRARGLGGVLRRIDVPATAPYTATAGDVVLSAARTLRGVVVDGDDHPLARTAVLVVGPRGDADPDVGRQHRRTDDLGRFAFNELGAGEFSVEASDGALRSPATVTVAPDADPPPVRLVLAAPDNAASKFPVRVRVTDEDGVPVPNVNVQLGYAANGAGTSVRTDAQGSVVAPAEFPPAHVMVSFWRNEALELVYERPGIVRLRPGQTEADVVLRRIGGTAGAEVLTGRVVDAGGAAVPYATVGVTVVGRAAEVMHGSGGRAGGWAQADSDGRFSVAVPRGATADLVARPQPDRRAAKLFGEVFGARPGERVEIVVRAPLDDRALDVTVVRPDGSALHGALVHVHYDGEDSDKPRMAQTDERGVVTFTGLPGAPLDLDVIVRDPAGRVNVSRTLYGAHATSGQRSVRVVFPDARTLRGRVLLPDGSPSAGAFVRAHTESGSAQTIADSSGAFAIELNDGGRLPISVSASPLPPDRSKPLMGWDVAEDFTRELEIRLGPVPVYGAR